MTQDNVEAVFANLIAEIEEVNVANGWFSEQRAFSADIALLYSEVGEMFDAWRQWGLEDATRVVCERKRLHNAEEDHSHLCKPEGVGSEAADVLIRLLDTCSRYEIDIVAEYRRKIAYNRTRPFRHGGKLL